MKIALVHDYFTQLGGAERVAEALYRILARPAVFTTVVNPALLPEDLQAAEIHTSFMQHLPGIQTYYRQYFPVYPFGVANLDLRGYELVVSSSSGYAKGVRVDPGAVHVCYCHTPMRWVWRYRDYASRERFSMAKRAVLPLLLNCVRRWDESAARQPDQFVVNSTVVAERVWDVYHRHAIVIPPPINVDRFRCSTRQDDFYLVLSRLVGYKRIDLAVDACNRLGRRLVVIGDGPDRSRLQRMAGPTVEFVGRVSDEVVESYVGRCRALIFPGEEDFGMVPLEVNAAGKPVIAYRAGGALDSVVDGVTGVYFDKDTVASLEQAVEELENRSWNAQVIRNHAKRFDTEAFNSRMTNLLSALSPQWAESQPVRKVAVGEGLHS